DEAAVRRVELASLAEQAEHDGRAGERDHAAVDDALGGGTAERDRDAEHGRERGADLDRSADEQEADDPLEARERELEADAEEQEDDADLGEHLDRLALADETEPVWS